MAITANTVYVASYFSPTGDFAVDRNYFNTAVNNPPLQALQNGASGPNAVYNYGSSSAFPTSSYEASNYWVDVVFNSSAGTAPLTITTTSLAGRNTIGGLQPDTGSNGGDHALQLDVGFWLQPSGRVNAFYGGSDIGNADKFGHDEFHRPGDGLK